MHLIHYLISHSAFFLFFSSSSRIQRDISASCLFTKNVLTPQKVHLAMVDVLARVFFPEFN